MEAMTITQLCSLGLLVGGSSFTCMFSPIDGVCPFTEGNTYLAVENGGLSTLCDNNRVARSYGYGALFIPAYGDPGDYGTSDGGATSYYDFPDGASTLNDLIEDRDMSFARGNIFKAVFRLGEKQGVDATYDLNKIIYFANRLKDMSKDGKPL